MIKNIFYILLIVLFLSRIDTKAQELPSTKGKQFWFTFMPNFHNYRTQDLDQTRMLESPDSLYIFISAEEPTQGTIQARNYFGQRFTWNFETTQPNEIYTLTLTNELFELEGKNFSARQNNYSQHLQIADQHFEINANNDVTVYALNKASTTSDAATIFPVNTLGKDYTIVSYNSHGNLDVNFFGAINDQRTYSQFAILAVEDATNVFINPSTNVGGSTVERKVTLNQGEVYLVQADTGERDIFQDLTGSTVMSDKPVAVFAGHQRALIPRYQNQYNSRDHLFSQMRPNKSYGKKYIITPFRQSVFNDEFGTDLFRIIALEDGTKLKLGNDEAIDMNKGDIIEDEIDKAILVESNNPIIVAQYKGSNTISNEITAESDPFIILVPPLKQYLNSYNITNIQVNNIDQQFSEQFITIICPTEYINTLRVDGRSLFRNYFTKIPNTCFSYYSMPAVAGTKKITGEKPFGVYVYGYGYADSYGYVGGMKFENREEVLPGTSRDRTVCIGDTLQMHVYGADDISWFPSDNLSCSDCSDPFVLEAENQTYYVEYADYLGCRYFDSVTVKVEITPIADLGPDIVTCDEDAVELDAGTDAEKYEWSPKYGLSCTDCRYPTASPNNTTTYTVKVSNGNCFSLDTIKISVGMPPEVNLQDKYKICEGDTAFVDVDTFAPDIRWSPDIDISCTDCKKPKIYPKETQYYYIEAISSNGCITLDSVLIEVDPLPNLVIQAPDSICPGEPFWMIAEGADIYKWSPDIEISCTDCPNPEVVLTESRMYYLEGETIDGCIAVDSVYVAVKDKPELIVIPEYEVCLNEMVQFNASGADNYRWYPSDNLSCNDCPDPVMNATNDMQYTLIGWNDDFCYDTAYVTVKTKSCKIEITGNIDFGSTLLCNSLDNNIEIINDNPDIVEIYNLTLLGEDADAFYIELPNQLRVVPANSSLFIPIEFTPGKLGFSNAQVEVISSIDSVIYIDVQGEAYSTEALFKLENNSVEIPTDTLKFSVLSNIEMLDEISPNEMLFKIKYDPYWMHFYNEYSINNDILSNWTIDAQSYNIASRNDHYLQFTLKGEEAPSQNGLLFNFQTIVLLSNLDNFKPEMEVSLLDKDICVNSTTESIEINLEYCVQNLRKVKISENDYFFETSGNIISGDLNIIFSVPFEQKSEIIIRNTLGEKVFGKTYNTKKGEHKVSIDLQNKASGSYFVEYRSGPFVEVKRIILMK